jgi:V8-like Glu-specific endopeptidase
MKTALYLSTFIAGFAVASLAYAADGVVGVNAKGGTVDVVRAKPMPMPMAPRGGFGIAKAAATSLPALGPSGIEPGAAGNGKMTPVTEPAPQPPAASGDSRSSQQYGTSKHPFTTSRADGSGFKVTSAYPWRATGKLFFTADGSSYVCSASLIKKGLMVTAAHCVIDYGAGASRFFTGHQFKPGYSGGVSPFGTWYAQKIYAMSAYVNGTDSCAVAGVVCRSDIAVVVLKPQSGVYPGTRTGWYGYGYGGYSYADGVVQVTQLGYPVALDSGGLMERTDSYGYVDSTSSNNTVIGSRQTGGSSGGPWLANFGVTPTQTSGYPEGAIGTAASANIVVGVTSWGYNDGGAMKEQGASPFLSTNIKTLIASACAAYPAACAN